MCNKYVNVVKYFIVEAYSRKYVLMMAKYIHTLVILHINVGGEE